MVSEPDNVMKAVARISETEWQVMKVLWARAPKSAKEVTQLLRFEDARWHPQTVKTLLHRLLKKQALAIKKSGRAYLYYPAVNEAACIDATCERFAVKYFDGSLGFMLRHFIQWNRLSPREVEALKQLME
jgi:BlaI family transcriptional regulator, penicillinase repressor